MFFRRQPTPTFEVGDIVELIKVGGMKANKGSRAVVVERDLFPDELQELVRKAGDSSKEFISIKWTDERTCSQENGFYHRERFKMIKKVNKSN